MSWCRGWQRGNDGRRTDLEHHAGHQLPGQSTEKGMAKCGQPDHQGKHEPAQAAVLGGLCFSRLVKYSWWINAILPAIMIHDSAPYPTAEAHLCMVLRVIQPKSERQAHFPPSPLAS